MHIVQVPNDLLVEVKGTVGGCSAISISRDGRWLAAACGDDKGRFKVRAIVYLVEALHVVPGMPKQHAACAISISREGGLLAAACGDVKGHFKVRYLAAWHAIDMPTPIEAVYVVLGMRIYLPTQMHASLSQPGYVTGPKPLYSLFPNILHGILRLKVDTSCSDWTSAHESLLAAGCRLCCTRPSLAGCAGCWAVMQAWSTA